MTAFALADEDPIERLVARAAAGDEGAFARIVDAHHLDMLRVAYIVSGDRATAEEAVATAWIGAWRRLGQLRDPARLRPWLVSIAANEARQLGRDRRRRTVREIAVDALAPGFGDTGAGDPAGRAADLDLANALARLSPDDRALLALRYVAGYDATEIGRLTGRTASGTRVRLMRLVGRLRKELTDD